LKESGKEKVRRNVVSSSKSQRVKRRGERKIKTEVKGQVNTG
jgi:hypothetical protein